jgi:hypothetical protein
MVLIFLKGAKVTKQSRKMKKRSRKPKIRHRPVFYHSARGILCQQDRQAAAAVDGEEGNTIFQRFRQNLRFAHPSVQRIAN